MILKCTKQKLIILETFLPSCPVSVPQALHSLLSYYQSFMFLLLFPLTPEHAQALESDGLV